jgi:HEPN domain-containing protein
MAIPSSKESRLFYRCAGQRFEEAEILLEAGKHTGAIYLAGYGIECMLKALVLSSVPRSSLAVVKGMFRGNRAHEYEWLKSEYRVRSGTTFPSEITLYFALVEGWSTDLRYEPGTLATKDAESFMKAARAIIDWIDRRL